jgi:two-component system osmolarity sensor histidine kinase EnvZ
VPYRPAGATEVRSAGRAFLEMRGRIESQIEQRTMMLSGVSHDLRTPLTRMRLGLSMLDQTPEVKDIERDVAEMEGLLDTFLDFAAARRWTIRRRPTPCASRERWWRTQGAAAARSPMRGPRWRSPCTCAPRRSSGRWNLVSNALRYGDRAWCRSAWPTGRCAFRWRMTAPASRRSCAAMRCKPFLRLDTARNQDRGSGVGLGLAIANDIAKRHGGTLRLGDSAALGGLRVDLILPR